MKKLYLNKFLLFSLVAAFLSLQWSSTHIHLAEQHEHDGGQHRHAATAHKHLLTNHHSDAFDIAASVDLDHSNVVELEHTCTASITKLLKHAVITNTSNFDLFDRACFSCEIQEASTDQPPHDYLEYSIQNTRGPPLTT